MNVALIATAGRSLRMGCAKAWLLFEGQSLLLQILQACAQAGLDRAIVVTGAHGHADAQASHGNLVCRDAVLPLVADLHRQGLEVSVTVADPEGCLIDSIRAGLGACPPDSTVLLWPVDHPFCGATLLRSLCRQASPDKIVAPSYAGKRGHPVVLGSDVVPELLTSIADKGAHAVVRRVPARVKLVPSSDPRITAALNTPEQAHLLGITMPSNQ